ncbi:DUF72 domain-containing protein [Gracilimonas halophila]|uniref:DUF72 domain-containing protein n=1 Tax=Gracilimonas halophila TaxID=1834464 RepID=A0ABW5JMB6_9BACT
MKFGSVDNPGSIDFTLPEDHPDTLKVLKQMGSDKLDAYVGCAKWNKKDLKGFYPRGTKDELTYYSRQFNSIELNATHYKTYGPEQAQEWKDKTPSGFKFFPKVVNSISHFKRLKGVEAPLEEYLHGMRGFGDQLEMIFLQLRDDFKPKDFDRVQRFVEIWPDDIPLAIELRHTDWFNDATVADQVYQLFEKHGVANVITDTAGRRDLLHMRLTSPVAFIRYVGANHESDYTRLDDWVERLTFWKEQGMEKLYFFVHQNMEKESPMLSAHFIKNINRELGTELDIPGENEQGNLGL